MVAEKIVEFHNELEKLKVEFDEVVSLLMKQKKTNRWMNGVITIDKMCKFSNSKKAEMTSIHFKNAEKSEYAILKKHYGGEKNGI